MNIEKIKDYIMSFKVAISRALTYISLPLSIVNFTLILINTAILTNFKSPKIIITMVSCLVLTLAFVGFMDRKLGLLKREQDIYVNHNPVFKKILNKLDKIEEKINKKGEK